MINEEEYWDEQLTLAIEIAHKAHAGQFRRDKVTPYIEHPKRVAELCTFPEEKCVAWLHDVVEDTDVTLADLQRYGMHSKIVLAVGALTKEPNQHYMLYLPEVNKNPLAKRVKICDMVANLTDSPTDRQIEKYTSALLLFSLDVKGLKE